MSVPHTFATQAGPIPLSWLDDNFAAVVGVTGNGVSMVAAGADGTGSVDCAGILATVLAALPAGGMIVFDAGKTFLLTSCNMNGKAATIYAQGATINCTSSAGGLLKSDHGNRISVVGGRWAATSTAVCIKYNATASANTYLDMDVHGAKFSSASGYCVSLVGCRETVWTQCEFTSTTTGGVYCNQANNPYFSQCIFIGQGFGYGFFADGQGSPNSGNPILRDCELMGWDINVKIAGCDDFKLDGCTVDYGVTYNTIISSQDGGSIRGCYLGSNTAVPALILCSEGANGWAPDNCQKITINSCNFTGHYTGGNTYDNVRLSDTVAGAFATAALYPAEIKLVNNHFQFWTRYAVNFAVNSERLLIMGNDFDPRATFGVKAIFNSNAAGGDSATIIAFNQFTPASFNPAGSGFQFTQFFNNTGIADFATVIDHASIQMQQNGNTGVGGPGTSYWHWVNQTSAIQLDRYGNTPTMRLRRANTGYAAPTAAANNDVSGAVAFDCNYDNTNYAPVAVVQAECDGAPSGSITPGRLLFETSAASGGVGNLQVVMGVFANACVAIDPNAADTSMGLLFHGKAKTTTTGIFSGSGAPAITAANGSLFLRTDGGAGTTLYVRESGAWVGK
jgi:hypothetical protein